MTPLMITLMVVAGIALLIAIGYLNHVAENGKLEKARTKVELSDRLRRCSEITEVFPGQLMSPALKLLLTRLELNVVQRMLNLDKGNAQLKHRIGELEEQIGKGERIDVPNPVAPIQTEAKAKDVRFLLEALHGQVTRAAHDGFLQTSEAKHWIREIRTILVTLHIEFFNNLVRRRCLRTSLVRPVWPLNAACSTCATSPTPSPINSNCWRWRNNWRAPTRWC